MLTLPLVGCSAATKLPDRDFVVICLISAADLEADVTLGMLSDGVVQPIIGITAMVARIKHFIDIGKFSIRYVKYAQPEQMDQLVRLPNMILWRSSIFLKQDLK